MQHVATRGSSPLRFLVDSLWTNLRRFREPWLVDSQLDA